MRQTNIEYEELPLSEGTMDYINESLKAVINETYGTAYSYFTDFPEGITVAGKPVLPKQVQVRQMLYLLHMHQQMILKLQLQWL